LTTLETVLMDTPARMATSWSLAGTLTVLSGPPSAPRVPCSWGRVCVSGVDHRHGDAVRPGAKKGLDNQRGTF
jgi:hypothetical protein